jgi:hypothetical protein
MKTQSTAKVRFQQIAPLLELIVEELDIELEYQVTGSIGVATIPPTAIIDFNNLYLEPIDESNPYLLAELKQLAGLFEQNHTLRFDVHSVRSSDDADWEFVSIYAVVC